MNTLDTKPRLRRMAMITGATGGLGKAFAVACASRGWDLFLTDTTEALLNTLAAGVENSYGVNIYTYACDLTDPAARNAMFRLIDEKKIRLGMLINVAGVDYEGRFLERTSQQIETIVRVNIEATLAVTHTALQYREPRDAFHLINVASMAGFYPMPVKATYAASKRFLIDFSLAMREELRPMGVHVTVLCPAGMPTNRECIRAIEVQGWAGLLTTVDTGRAANETLDAAMAGKAIVIPGGANRFIRAVGSIVPPAILAKLIFKRWTSVRQSRSDLMYVDPHLPAQLPDSPG